MIRILVIQLVSRSQTGTATTDCSFMVPYCLLSSDIHTLCVYDVALRSLRNDLSNLISLVMDQLIKLFKPRSVQIECKSQSVMSVNYCMVFSQ